MSLLEFSSELQTLLVKGENCVFDEVFKNTTLTGTLMGLIKWHTIAPKNIHETLIWLFNSTSSFDFLPSGGEIWDAEATRFRLICHVLSTKTPDEHCHFA